MKQPLLHPTAILAWLLAVLIALSMMRNPLHLLLAVCCIAAVSAGQQPIEQLPMLKPHWLILGLILTTALLNGLNVRFGSTQLINIPQAIPLLAGPITLEAVVYGATTGLLLAGMLIAFGVVQRTLPTSALIQLIPRAFAPLAIVSAIAITFVPMLLRQALQIREAQRMRGHQLHGLRDWLPLFLPLLINSLERSLQLAEAIATRGIVRSHQSAHTPQIRGGFVVGLILLLAGGVLSFIWGQDRLGQILMLIGGGVLLVLLWWLGRQMPYTRYQQYRYTGRDGAVLIGAAVVIGALLLPWPGIDHTVLAYYPYPLLQLPAFDMVLGIATLGLLWPVVAWRIGEV